MINHKEILDQLRAFMLREGLDFFIVSSTDEFLNEYIFLQDNSRYLITGFSGSTGDALVTKKDVFLFVDGRYHLQADNETDSSLITVEKVGLELAPYDALVQKIAQLVQNNQKIALVNKKISVFNYRKLFEVLKVRNVKCVDYDYDPVIEFSKPDQGITSGNLRYIPSNISGITAEEKFRLIRDKFNSIDTDIFVLTKLEEIAYFLNLRGDDISYSSTFKARAILYKDKLAVFCELDKVPAEIRGKFGELFAFNDNSQFMSAIEDLKVHKMTIGFNPRVTNVYIYRQIEGNNPVEVVHSPILEMMARKNTAELEHMKECFRKTDIVVNRAIAWLNQSLEDSGEITEKEFSEKVKELFLEEGAYGLSFEVIAASGKNTAIIHYTNPDHGKNIESGDLVLLDCGGYFEGGYATDITRTFLAGGSRVNSTEEQKKIYTKVLRAFLNGLNYNLSPDTTGYDIDKIVRDIVTKDTDQDFKFSHGTGHGVGIAVHEPIPRLGPSEVSKIKLEPGMCFSIEPGLYADNWGGVRLENTVSVIKTESGNKIETLTKSKFDENLIDFQELTEQEKSWLEEYQKRAIG